MLLSNKDYKNILDFSCEVGKNCLDFYDNTLKLVSKYFNYTNLAFFPENINTSSINDINKVYLTKFYSINLEKNFIREFKEHYYKSSIFQPLNLSEKLLSNSIIAVDDIMSYDNFLQTDNSRFLNKYNFHYRLNVNLYSNNIKLGTLCIFKSKEDGNFTKKDCKILEILSDLLSSHYKNFLNLSSSLLKQELFKKYYNTSSHGIIIWYHRQCVIESNNKAEEFSSEIAKYLNTSEEFTHTNLLGLNQDISPIQKTLSYLSYNFIQNGTAKNIDIISNNYIYNIKTSIITTLSTIGSLETIYFTCITKSGDNEAILSDKTKGFYSLTDRELEIINLIKKGYSNNQISAELYLSNNTVKTHVKNIFKKLKVNNRTSLLNKINLN